MLLTVETGRGLSDANSYIDLTDAEFHMPSIMYEKWVGLSKAEQIDRLVIASLFVDGAFDWVGTRKTHEQGMNWPRLDVWMQKHMMPSDCVPTQVKRACVMAIGLIMDCGLNVFRETGEAQVRKEKLGPLEKEYFEALKTEFTSGSRYSDINNALRGLYRTPGGVMAAEVVRQ